jgi:hypothetical protein
MVVMKDLRDFILISHHGNFWSYDSEDFNAVVRIDSDQKYCGDEPIATSF